MTIQLTIIGLGQTGASIGLVLQEQKGKILRTGLDRSGEITTKALKMGAIDRGARTIAEAVKDADVIVLTTPVDELKETLEIIGPMLREGAVVVDTSPLKIQAAAWAQEFLPAGRHFIGMTPTFNPAHFHETKTGLDAAHSDLFDNSLMIVASFPDTHPDAVKLVSDLSQLLHSQVLFADPHEADGLSAASDLLPKLTAAALVHTVQSQPAWREGRKFAGPAYASATEPVLSLNENETPGITTLANSDNCLRVLDDLITALTELRTVIAEQDAEALTKILDKARQDRRDWGAQRVRADWDKIDSVQTLSASEAISGIFGFRRKAKEKTRNRR
ncbi:MAG TPA: prephenate dehydrogenase [Anaerolineaceae bacterium]|jgi:prephenate dehydrogenase|nr:prephenate dehydrogenase [Anaerolineaceae bacterium]